MSINASKRETTLEHMPKDVMQLITKGLNIRNTTALRSVSHHMKGMVNNRLEREQKIIWDCAVMFFSPQSISYDVYSRNIGYKYEKGDQIWSIAVKRYDFFPNLQEITVVKANNTTGIEGAIRMMFSPEGSYLKKRLKSYKHTEKAWIMAFLVTIVMWLKNENNTSENYIRSLLHPDIPDYGNSHYNKYLRNKQSYMNQMQSYSQQIWRSKKREDSDFANEMRMLQPLLTPNVHQKTRERPPVKSSKLQTVTPGEDDQGRTIISQMRQTAKNRESRLNKGMLGHTAAIKAFLNDLNTASKSTSKSKTKSETTQSLSQSK